MTALVLPPAETDLRRIVEAINQLASGRSNAVGLAIITTGVTNTTVTAITVGLGSTICLTPLSNGAASFRNWVETTEITPGQRFLISHPVTTTAGLTYTWLAIG